MNQINILIATYNGEAYLAEQINSIVVQTHKSWNILIHDDNSTDNTLKIIYEFVEKYPFKIKLIDDEKSFASSLANFSFLLEQSHANYIMFCDQDDIWEKDKVEKTLAKMQSMEKVYNDAPLLVHTDLKVVDEKLNTLHDSFWRHEHILPQYNSLSRLLVQNTITGCTMMINRKLAEISLPVPKDAMMHDWWIGLVASNFGKIGYIKETTIQYRQHSQNAIGAKGFNLQYVLEHMFKSNLLSKNISQAKAFLIGYRDRLDQNTIEMLEDFITIESKSFWQKRKILFRHKLLKQGFIRNMGLFIKI